MTDLKPQTPNPTLDPRWIQLHSGAPYWPLAPESCTISIEDIAHSLANNNRFNGHTREPYSVAQHSVLVSQLCESELDRVRPCGSVSVDMLKLPLYALLHDASEAVLHDIVRPLKADFRIGHDPYTSVERRIQWHIQIQFGLDPGIMFDKIQPAIDRADNILLVTEQRDLMAPSAIPWHKIDAEPLAQTITPWTWQEAETRFLDRFYKLTRTVAS